MPKVKKKKKKAKKAVAKRTVTCSKCKGEGHNARTCPEKAETPAPEVEAKPTPKVEPPEESKAQRRAAPTQGTTSNVAPYRCNKCNNVAILVAVKIKDYDQSFKQKKEVFTSDLRCEKCMNKPSPSDLILKWGATPDEVVPIPGQDA